MGDKFNFTCTKSIDCNEIGDGIIRECFKSVDGVSFCDCNILYGWIGDDWAELQCVLAAGLGCAHPRGGGDGGELSEQRLCGLCVFLAGNAGSGDVDCGFELSGREHPDRADLPDAFAQCRG